MSRKTPAQSDTSMTSVSASVAQLKKPDLLDQVVARSLLKKRDVKPALDAALALIGEALARGDELILPPLGKIRVVKTKDIGDGAQLLTLKLRSTKDASQTVKTGLATDREDV
ncbi:HU family DNA-binding protein [Yoonia vestfoldensis]|uniref:HU family DNA-binding protein n=1 Tax=Yoonia vestfoldensis TaxID=245188 RepID=UPI00039DF67A|nr:HU family DNA-binding protein [Yoonia vestfoldensis]